MNIETFDNARTIIQQRNAIIRDIDRIGKPNGLEIVDGVCIDRDDEFIAMHKAYKLGLLGLLNKKLQTLNKSLEEL